MKKEKTKRPSSRKRKAADDVLSQVIRMTGIPAGTIRKELGAILEKKGLDPKNLTLDQLRTVVAHYLREIMAGVLEASTSRSKDRDH